MEKNNEIKISIAMCTYNGERFIKEQLDSILNQSYKNLEIIITDDKSTDKTIDIIKKYQLADDRIKLYQNEKNLGFVKNFEKAISLCSGNYIALSDQDDIWKNNKIEVFLEKIKNNLLIYSDAELIDEFSNKSNKQLIRPHINLVSGKCNKAFLFYNCASGNTMMFKKELVKYILPIPKEFSFHDIWIAFIASTLGTITYTEESMTYYRRYNEQVTRTVEKDYQSFRDRFNQKTMNKLKMIQQRKIDFELLIQLDFLDLEVKKIIEVLIQHFIKYEQGYFNKNLFMILDEYKDELFAIKNERKRKKYVTRESMKLKLQKILLFSY